ncbi:transmembrane 9 superfamily member 1-like [Xenia sp. Carnegie-2017]|uniref:transmembrane 9 superfamily member 1-like n=1 Tax=Xenia sp. Carnegie-2017 TaxID=2897299 RepID=UPI001F03589D|nr:transmembrane 9 superfamily member 1-like [Xenia sp. Carnegie-2017]
MAADTMKVKLSSTGTCFILVFLINTVYAGNIEDGKKILLYVNKVGPYFNPHETYHYYSLPVCAPEKIEQRSLTLGEVLKGDRMAESIYEIHFKKSFSNKQVCSRRLSSADLRQLRNAIEDHYYFEFVLDDIRLHGFIGHFSEGHLLPHTQSVQLFTHLHFIITYNGNQIISANVSTGAPVDLPETGEMKNVQFTYGVEFVKTKETKRVRNTDGDFFPQSLEIHWLSIINSAVLVFLLIGFVIIILMRVLKNDFARYNVDENDLEGGQEQDDYGWKIINTDVFRFPNYKSWLCAILGNGSQFLTICFGIILMAIFGMFSVHRHGSMNTASVLIYALTCCVSGYVASSMYKKIGGINWAWNIVLTATLFAVPFFVIWSIMNSVAWYNNSTQALPFTTIVLLMLIWLIVGFPLTVIGGIFGKNWSSPFGAPCRTKNIPREIPQPVWYRSHFVHMIVGGFLPFSAISVELYYIFSTIWGHDHYTLYGILLIVFLILLSVTACISIALTYFQLSSEDYRWWWRSVFSSGSTGLFVFFYSMFYFMKRSSMSGAVQTTQFLGWTILICYIFFLMLGTVSFFVSLHFIKYIYVNLKND